MESTEVEVDGARETGDNVGITMLGPMTPLRKFQIAPFGVQNDVSSLGNNFKFTVCMSENRGGQTRVMPILISCESGIYLKTVIMGAGIPITITDESNMWKSMWDWVRRSMQGASITQQTRVCSNRAAQLEGNQGQLLVEGQGHIEIE